MQLPLPEPLRSPVLRPLDASIKRLIDVLMAAGALLTASPIILAAALGARLANGRAIYAQERIGLYGRPFKVYKICSMRQIAGVATTNTAADDPRITPFGRFIRKWKIDELPQLWNVLKGDMSLVGPRPDVAVYFAALPEDCADMLRVRPGITSPLTIDLVDEELLLARVGDPDHYYMNTLFPQKVARNLEYVRSHSLGLDIKTLFGTAIALGRRIG